MTSAPIAKPLPPLSLDVELPVCDRIQLVGGIVIQLAIRVIFVGAALLASAAAFPIAFHAVVLPAVGLSATFLSGFFFPKPGTCIWPALLPPALCRQIAPPLPAGAPLGLVNSGNNCCFNAMVHFLESDPQIAAWLRHPITPETTLDAFKAFLAEYDPPPSLVPAFDQYIANQAPPLLPFPTLFTNFMAEFVPSGEEGRQTENIKETFKKIFLLQPAYYQFLAAYDQAATQGNRWIDQTPVLRQAISAIAPEAQNPNTRRREPTISPGNVQEDASEIMNVILSLLPNRMKFQITHQREYHMAGMPEIEGMLDGQRRIQPPERLASLLLQIPADDPHPNLERMFGSYLVNQTTIERRSVEGANRMYPVTERTVFTELPPVLRIIVGREKQGLQPGERIKNTTPVEIPHELTVQIENGQQKRYRLASFVEHSGASAKTGHYIAGKIVGDQKYLADDVCITQLSQAEWEQHLQNASLLCYLPV